MTLQKDQPKPKETRTQKIVKWSVIGVAAALVIAAIIIGISFHVNIF
ncbi:MAG TPA: hypothetical protein VGI56_06380 [Galbitalea sp.]|jgi:hypothetical protein